MMAITHALAGALLAVPVVLGLPAVGSEAMLVGLLGGLFPDFDLYTGHRKRLHYPVYGSLAALGAGIGAFLWTTPATVLIAVFLGGMALHATSDILGAGLELRPWEGQSDRAVYDHYYGQWRAPRRLVRYDGAPEDIALATVCALPVMAVLSQPLVWLIAGLLLVGSVYGLARKHLAVLACHIAQRLPQSLQPYVPARYTDAA